MSARFTITDLLEAAQEVTPFTIGELIGSWRYAPLSRVRQAVYYLAREQGFSYPLIAKRVNRKDHTTIIYGVQRCNAFMVRRPEYAETVRRIRMRAVWLAERRLILNQAAMSSYITAEAA